MRFSALRAATGLALVSSLLVTGCGGGGGSGSTTPSPDRNAAIKSANASAVGAQAFWALDFLNGQINASVLNVSGATTADLSSTLCSVNGVVSGSSTRTVDTSAKTVTLHDVNCDNGVWKSNGTTTIQLSNLQGDPFNDPAWSGTLTVTFNFTTAFDPLTSTQTGDLTINYVQTAPNVGSFVVTNNALQTRLEAGSAAIERDISQVAYTGSIDSSGLNTFTADFTLSGSFGKLGTASYAVKKTSTAFTRQTTNGQATSKPSQGVMTVKASDNSSLAFTAVNTSTAGLGVDWNGDNVIDSSSTSTWDELSTLSNAVYMLYQQ